MSSLGCITGRDKWDLSDNLSVAVTFLIENDEGLSRVAEHFNGGDKVSAFSDIMKKGLQDLLDLCDMEDHFTEIEMKNPPVPKGGSL